MVMLPSWSMMIGVPSFHPGQLSSTQIRVAHSQISYPPERMPDRLMYPTLTMSLSLERTLPSCWLVVPWRMVLLMCSRISAVLRGRSPRNFLIFSRMRTVFMFLSSFEFRFSLLGDVAVPKERGHSYNRSSNKRRVCYHY